MFATITGPLIDLTPIDFADEPCLSAPDDAAYRAGNELAVQVIKSGLSGIVYPSKRRPGGTCAAVLKPSAVADVAQGNVHRLTWRAFRLTIEDAVNLNGQS